MEERLLAVLCSSGVDDEDRTKLVEFGTDIFYHIERKGIINDSVDVLSPYRRLVPESQRSNDRLVVTTVLKSQSSALGLWLVFAWIKYFPSCRRRLFEYWLLPTSSSSSSSSPPPSIATTSRSIQHLKLFMENLFEMYGIYRTAGDYRLHRQIGWLVHIFVLSFVSKRRYSIVFNELKLVVFPTTTTAITTPSTNSNSL